MARRCVGEEDLLPSLSLEVGVISYPIEDVRDKILFVDNYEQFIGFEPSASGIRIFAASYVRS